MTLWRRSVWMLLSCGLVSWGCGAAPAAPSAVATFTVSGVVRDAGSSLTVEGVQVELVAGPVSGKSASTNTAGEFTLAGVPPGGITIRASKNGYAAADRTFTISANTNVDVLLMPSLSAAPAPQPPVEEPSSGAAPSPAAPPVPAPAPSPATFVLAGRVFATPDEQFMSGVEMRITAGPNAGRTAMTNSGGEYRFAGLQSGTGTIELRKAGYVTLRRDLETRSNENGQDFTITRTTFQLSGATGDALGLSRISLGEFPRATVVSGPTKATATSLPKGYRFDNLAWGTYTFRVAEQGGSSRCFVPVEFSLVVTADDVAGGRTTFVRDVAFARQRGTVKGRIREKQPEGGSNAGRARVEIIASHWGVPANVGKSAASSGIENYNLTLPDVACDSVRLRVTPRGREPFEVDETFSNFGAVSCTPDTLCADFILSF